MAGVSETASMAERIEAWMAVRQMTRAELASAVGVTLAAVWYWLHVDPVKRTQPTGARLQKIADAFEVSLERFFGPLPARRASDAREAKSS